MSKSGASSLSRLGFRVGIVAEAAEAFGNPTAFETLLAFRYPKVELTQNTSAPSSFKSGLGILLANAQRSEIAGWKPMPRPAQP